MPLVGTLGADTSHVHRAIDNSIVPVLTVAPGDTVRFEAPGPPFPPDATAEDIGLIDFDWPHTMVGPVYVEGAHPGDALVVEILEVDVARDYGHCLFVPGLGLRPERYDTPYIHNFRFEGGFARLCEGVRIRLRPFLGIMGCAPSAPGKHATFPPRRVGGNIDIKTLTTGATLLLPVEVEGALFSCGDGHGAQGAGEVCGTGLETAVGATLRFGLDPARELRGPAFEAPPEEARARRYGFTAVGPDLYDCSERAIDAMLDYLRDERGLAEEHAYVLCSLAADLTIEEIVDAPNWLVSATIPLDVFDTSN
jgi:acetamidase/formamidase